MFYFWREVSRRMNIKQLPDDYDSFERFNREYERENFRYTDANKRVGGATLEMFVGWFPRFLSPIVRPAIVALLDERLVRSFGFPRPSRFMHRWVPAMLRLRATVARCLPPLRRPRLRTQMPHRTYPRGYAIERLGPPGTSR